MNTNTAPKNDLWIWAAIHISVIIAIPIILSIMSSCIKKPELKSANLGLEIQLSDVDAAIGDALQSADPYAISPNQAVHFVSNYRVETEALVEYQELIQQVTGIVDNSNEFTVIFDMNIFDLEKNKPPVMRETTESEMQFPPRPLTPMEAMTSNARSTSEFIAQALSERAVTSISPELYKLAGKDSLVAYADREYIKTSLHNLKVKKFSVDPPPAVRARPNCGDVPDCKLNVTELKFDAALWYSEAEFDKVSYEMQVSTDVPYLGKLISDCTTQQQFIGERDYVIRNCVSLYDFVY